MRAQSVFAFVFILISTVCLAGAEKVSWEQGVLVPQADRMVVVFPDGTRLSLKNIQLTPEQNGSVHSEGRTRLEVVTAAKLGEVPVTEHLMSMYDTPTVGAPLRGLKVARVRAGGKLHLLLVASDGEFKLNDTSYARGGVVALTLSEPSSEGMHTISAQKSIEGELHLYANELAVVPMVKDTYSLFVYDDWSATLRRVPMHYDPRSGTLDHMATDQNFPMPSSFARGKSFSEGGELFVYTDNSKGALTLKTAAGELINFGVDAALEAEDTFANGQEARKVLSRAVWEKGLPSIERFLNSRGQTSTSALELGQQIRTWAATSGGTRPRKTAKNARRGGQGVIDTLFLSVSTTLAEQYPGLRDQAALEVLRNVQATNVYYLRVPPHESGRSSEALRVMFTELAHAKATARQDVLFVVDGLDFFTGGGRYSGLGNMLNGLSEWLAQSSVIDARLAVICRPEQLSLPEFDEAVRERGEIFVDRFVSAEERLAVLQSALRTRGYRLELAELAGMLTEIERTRPPGTDLYSDLTILARNLSTVLYHSQVQPGQPGFTQAAGRLYAQITGERQVGPFPAEVLKKLRQIPRVLSASYPGHGERALQGRDPILKHVESKLVSWLGYGYREYPTLPLLFFGDNGTGKTMLANGIAETLGAAVETVNFSAIAKPTARFGWGEYFGDSSRQPESDLKPIQEKVEKLVLDPNPVKILILDEIHTHPDLLNALLPALGNSDRKAPGVLNLEGIIVIMIANVDIDSQSYRELSQMQPTDRLYPQNMFQLFKASMAGRDKRVDEKLAGALGGRLLPGMIFFPPLGMDVGQQASLIDKVLLDYEDTNHMRLVVQDAARKHLSEIAASYTDGNYRSVERAVRDEITAAFGRFAASQPERKLEGYFVLGSSAGAQGKVSLDLIEIEGEGPGAAAVVSDGFRRFNAGVQGALGYATEVLASGNAAETSRQSSALLDANRRALKLLLDAFGRASEKPLVQELAAPSVDALIDPLMMPSKLTPGTERELRQFLGDTVRGLFTRFADYNQRQSALSESQRLLEMSGELGSVLSVLVRLHKIETESGAAKKPFAAWVEKIRKRYVETVKVVTGVEPAVAEGSIEALSVAAGYLTSDLARQSAGALLSDLKRDARERLLRSPRTLGHDTSLSPLTAECERLLLGGQATASKLDKIFGRK